MSRVVQPREDQPEPSGTVASAINPPLIGLVLGLSAALPLYLWQSQLHVGAAAFLITGYTGWLWAATRVQMTRCEHARARLLTLPQNAPWRRVLRMIADPGFWWSMLFGASMVTGSVWYAGMRETSLLISIAAAWCVVAACLSYGVTLRGSTSRCRRCGYQLSGHLHDASPDQTLVCPECGSAWAQRQLSLQSPAPEVRRAA